jgi:uncharacterized damage-inducible protein DinB
MTEITRIQDQLRRSMEGGAWHGPGVLELLEEVSAEAATVHALPGAHSIWEILLHMTSTQELVQRRLDGNPTALAPEENWPAVTDPSPDAWKATQMAFQEGYRKLMASIHEVDPERLDDPVFPGFSSFYVTLHGLVQHNLYHGGQIGILRKATGVLSL